MTAPTRSLTVDHGQAPQRSLTDATHNCQPPADARFNWGDQLGSVTIENDSPCINDYTFIVWQVDAYGNQRNVSQITRTFQPHETATMTLGVSMVYGMVYQRDVFFGLTAQDHPFNENDVANAKFYAPGGPYVPSDASAPIVIPSSCPAAALIAAASVLGDAQPFAVLAGSTVTNTGPTVLNGDLGLYAGTSITGFPPGLVTGTVHQTDVQAQNAQTSMTTAYNALVAESCLTTYGPGNQDLGGLTLTPGVYCFASSASITGTVTLDAQGDPNAVFIFNVGSTLTTAAGSSMSLINGAQPCNSFWAVGTSATLNSASNFVGNILAQASISVSSGVNVMGRLLAKAAVTLINDTVSPTSCTSSPSPASPPTLPASCPPLSPER